MGWWQINGRSGGRVVAIASGVPTCFWGDGPADILDAAIDKITDEFRQDWQREPSDDELRAGLEFSLPRRPMRERSDDDA